MGTYALSSPSNQWTYFKPATNGWYWYRKELKTDPIMVEVILPYVFVGKTGGSNLVKNLAGEWQGPLKPSYNWR